MNAERLHVIADALKDELFEHDTPSLLRKVTDETDAMDKTANPSGHQQTVADLRRHRVRRWPVLPATVSRQRGVRRSTN